MIEAVEKVITVEGAADGRWRRRMIPVVCLDVQNIFNRDNIFRALEENKFPNYLI